MLYLLKIRLGEAKCVLHSLQNWYEVVYLWRIECFIYRCLSVEGKRECPQMSEITDFLEMFLKLCIWL